LVIVVSVSQQISAPAAWINRLLISRKAAVNPAPFIIFIFSHSPVAVLNKGRTKLPLNRNFMNDTSTRRDTPPELRAGIGFLPEKPPVHFGSANSI
jgi:hypothetical protein